MFPFSVSSAVSLPVDLVRTGSQVGLLMVESQAVVALRLLGLTGFWAVTPSETSVMISEKGPTLAKAASAATRAMASGKRPDQVLDAAVRPLRSRTRANVRRLSKRGPKLPGF